MIKRKHAVMMEYVIIAVLVAAAVVGAVIMFSKTISKEMDVASQAMHNPNAAASKQQNNRDTHSAAVKKAQDHEGQIHGDSSKK